jgi:succinyl-CoA:acetate CoA-transferase
MLPPDNDTQAIANHLVRFFENEVENGAPAEKPAPLQVGWAPSPTQ